MPAGALHPLSAGATGWVSAQLARQRRAMAQAARRGMAGGEEEEEEGAPGSAGLFAPLPLPGDDASSPGASGPLAYAWPVPDLLPLPALLRVGGGGAGHAEAREAMGALLEARAAGARAGDGGGGGRWAAGAHARAAGRARARAARLAALPLLEALPAASGGAPGGALPGGALRAGGGRRGWAQPWLAPSLRLRLSARTLRALARPELRALARGAARLCGDLARGAAAGEWSGASLLAGGLAESGCGAQLDMSEEGEQGAGGAREGVGEGEGEGEGAAGGARESGSEGEQGAAGRAREGGAEGEQRRGRSTEGEEMRGRSAEGEEMRRRSAEGEEKRTRGAGGEEMRGGGARGARGAPRGLRRGGRRGEGAPRGTVGTRRPLPALLPSQRLWAPAGAGAAALRVVLLGEVRIDVRASDPQALRRTGAGRAAGGRALSEAAVEALMRVVRGSVPPAELAAAEAAEAAGERGEQRALGALNASAGGGAALLRVLRDSRARLAALTLPISAGAGGAAYAYAEQPLPWGGQDETFLLTIDEAGEAPAGEAAVSDGEEEALCAALGAARNGSGGGGGGGCAPARARPRRISRASAALSACSLWGAIRGLQALSQTLGGWALAEARAHRAGPPLRGDASGLWGALLAGAGAAPAPPHPRASSSLPSLASRLRGPCAAGVAVGALRAGGPWPDPGRPLPLRLPLTLGDAPWRPWRGLSLDTARHFIPLPALLRAVDALAAARGSVLHWHLADAQSWPLEMEGLPGEAGGRRARECALGAAGAGVHGAPGVCPAGRGGDMGAGPAATRGGA